MAATEGLRAQKKRATRQRISDVATKLFIARGFEQVTVDEVAAEANVAKMTVFNYFPRKEDLFFDRTTDVRQLLEDAVEGRGPRSPLAALRALAHDLVAREHPVAKVNRDVAANWKAVAASPALRARAHDLFEELEEALAGMLAEAAKAPTDDPTARLLAAMLLGAWRIAFREALRRYRTASAGVLRKALLELVDRGFSAAAAAARGTPYAVKDG